MSKQGWRFYATISRALKAKYYPKGDFVDAALLGMGVCTMVMGGSLW